MCSLNPFGILDVSIFMFWFYGDRVYVYGTVQLLTIVEVQCIKKRAWI